MVNIVDMVDDYFSNIDIGIYIRRLDLAEVDLDFGRYAHQYSVVVEYYTLARPEIKSYNNRYCLKISVHVFYIFYQKSPAKIYLWQTF